MSKKNLALGTPCPPLNQLKILAAGNKIEPPGATFGPRRQFCWEFIWVREGSVTARVDDVAVEGTPGTVLLIPPRGIDVYDWSQSSRTSHSFLHFDFALPEHLTLGRRSKAGRSGANFARRILFWRSLIT